MAEAEIVISQSLTSSDRPKTNAFEKLMNAEQPASKPENKINQKPATKSKGKVKGSQQMIVTNKWGLISLKIPEKADKAKKSGGKGRLGVEVNQVKVQDPKADRQLYKQDNPNSCWQKLEVRAKSNWSEEVNNIFDSEIDEIYNQIDKPFDIK